MREYIEHVIKPQETLQGLALLYRCSVIFHQQNYGILKNLIFILSWLQIFELKLANSIQKDTEFFARRTLRIPVRQYSFLTEKVHNNTVSDLIPPLNSSVTDNGGGTSLNGASNPTTSSTHFLQQVDQDLLRLKEKARVYDITIPTSTPSDAVRFRQSIRAGRSSDCSGDDCGLSWTHIFGIALLVLLACPLLYFLYLELNLHRTLHNETASAAPVIHDDADAASLMNMSNNIS